ncbi:Exopolyphosphatase [Massospora cicadina]|nr:Exopolyphosphatase [Massospora cicadina]
MGNEAADLDSIISSLSYALLSTHFNEGGMALTLPLINLPREEIDLRPEVLHVMERNGVPVELLLFIDDPPVLKWEALATNDKRWRTNFILMDHNKLHPRFRHWQGQVTAIFDHHEDERAHLDANPRVIRPVGSNTSLVVEWWGRQSPIPHDELFASLAPLMLAPILIDTVNLRGEYGRVTPTDIASASTLCALVEPSNFNGCTAYFDEIDAAKTRVRHLTPAQLLRRDYKVWTTPLTRLAAGPFPTPNLWMKTYAAQHRLDLLVVMGPIFLHVGSGRLCPSDQELPSRSELGLVPSDTAPREGFAFYTQTVISASRKVTSPIFRDLLDAVPCPNPPLGSHTMG